MFGRHFEQRGIHLRTFFNFQTTTRFEAATRREIRQSRGRPRGRLQRVDRLAHIEKRLEEFLRVRML